MEQASEEGTLISNGPFFSSLCILSLLCFTHCVFYLTEGMDLYMWFEPNLENYLIALKYEGIEDTVRQLVAFIKEDEEKNGPFDGVIGKLS